MKPITGDPEDCARTPNGHATAEPATALMKSRLRTQSSTRGRPISFSQSLTELEDAVRGTHAALGQKQTMPALDSLLMGLGHVADLSVYRARLLVAICAPC
jgi:hypothetical protein